MPLDPMNSESEVPAFSIGAVFGDWNSELRAWDEHIKLLMRQVMDLRSEGDAPLRLNIVFHLDGKLVPLDFEGVRTGRFSKKDSVLMVQAAVPPGPVDDRRGVLLRLMNAAVDEAEAFARRRHIAEDLREIREVVVKLGAGDSVDQIRVLAESEPMPVRHRVDIELVEGIALRVLADRWFHKEGWLITEVVAGSDDPIVTSHIPSARVASVSPDSDSLRSSAPLDFMAPGPQIESSYWAVETIRGTRFWVLGDATSNEIIEDLRSFDVLLEGRPGRTLETAAVPDESIWAIWGPGEARVPRRRRIRWPWSRSPHQRYGRWQPEEIGR